MPSSARWVARQVRTDSPLEGDGFELPVPRTTPGFWPISTRTTRRDRCRKKGVRIRQLLVFAALGREWWARRRGVLRTGCFPRQAAFQGGHEIDDGWRGRDLPGFNGEPLHLGFD